MSDSASAQADDTRLATEAPIEAHATRCDTPDCPRLQQKRQPSWRIRQIAGWTRFIAAIPAIGLFLSSLTLALGTLFHTFTLIYRMLTEQIDMVEMATLFIESADIFLLGVVLYIMALGLFTLFVSGDTPLPGWLSFQDFDDLKERLVSVICVMMGVHFLGVVLHGAYGIDLVWLGLATAIVVIAMTLFVRLVIKQEE